MIARMRSITLGDLECLELMLATTDLLSHHMRIDFCPTSGDPIKYRPSIWEIAPAIRC